MSGRAFDEKPSYFLISSFVQIEPSLTEMGSGYPLEAQRKNAEERKGGTEGERPRKGGREEGGRTKQIGL